MLDYIIVGLGLAGMAFARELEIHKKTFVVFEDYSQTASRTAAGVYNPVVLKRFTPIWRGASQMAEALPFYESIEKQLHVKCNTPLSIFRRLNSIEEQNNWFCACDKPALSSWMIPEIRHMKFQGIEAPFGYGEVIGTGKIAIRKLLDAYQKHLGEKVVSERFLYHNLIIDTQHVIYKNHRARRVVFCEGYGIKSNPWFGQLPLRGTKGELITIHAPKLKCDKLIKSSVFILPLGNDLYRVGATFNRKDTDSFPSREGAQELSEKLNSFLKTPYRIVEHKAGIRPTVKDRRPLIGTHEQFKQLAVLNGLGTRGVLLAPAMAKALYQHLEHHTPPDNETAITRFSN